MRAASGFYAGKVISACRRHDVRYSITVRKNAAIHRAIDAIAEHDWIPIPYWLDGGADVAKTFDVVFGPARFEDGSQVDLPGCHSNSSRQLQRFHKLNAAIPPLT